MNAPYIPNAESYKLPRPSHPHPALTYILGLSCGLLVAAGLVITTPAPGLRCATFTVGEAR